MKTFVGRAIGFGLGLPVALVPLLAIGADPRLVWLGAIAGALGGQVLGARAARDQRVGRRGRLLLAGLVVVPLTYGSVMALFGLVAMLRDPNMAAPAELLPGLALGFILYGGFGTLLASPGAILALLLLERVTRERRVETPAPGASQAGRAP
jgi:hypothetical protein